MGNFGRDRRGGGRSFDRNRGGFGGRHGGFGGDRRGGRDSDRREMFNSVCSSCGKECQIPFKPTGGKPVYCSECFEKIGGGRDTRRTARSDFRPQNLKPDQNKAQFDAINAKLDKILSIIAPTPVVGEEENEDSVFEKETETAKPNKTKKVASKKKK